MWTASLTVRLTLSYSGDTSVWHVCTQWSVGTNAGLGDVGGVDANPHSARRAIHTPAKCSPAAHAAFALTQKLQRSLHFVHTLRRGHSRRFQLSGWCKRTPRVSRAGSEIGQRLPKVSLSDTDVLFARSTKRVRAPQYCMIISCSCTS